MSERDCRPSSFGRIDSVVTVCRPRGDKLRALRHLCVGVENASKNTPVMTNDEELRALELSTHFIDRLAATDDLQEAWRAALQASLTITHGRRGGIYVRAPDVSLNLVMDIDFATLPGSFPTYASMQKDPALTEATLVAIGEPSPRPLARTAKRSGCTDPSSDRSENRGAGTDRTRPGRACR